MSDMGSIFGIIGVLSGLYIFYEIYRMKTSGEISSSILISKNLNVAHCKDKQGYIEEAVPKMSILGIAVLIYGGSDLFHTYVHPVSQVLLWVILAVFFVILIWFAKAVDKMNKKYF